MDREHADFAKILDQLQHKFGSGVVALTIPIVEGGKVTGYIDVIEQKGYDGGWKRLSGPACAGRARGLCGRSQDRVGRGGGGKTMMSCWKNILTAIR